MGTSDVNDMYHIRLKLFHEMRCSVLSHYFLRIMLCSLFINHPTVRLYFVNY